VFPVFFCLVQNAAGVGVFGKLIHDSGHTQAVGLVKLSFNFFNITQLVPELDIEMLIPAVAGGYLFGIAVPIAVFYGNAG
jgi:hypothetical protein